MGISFYYIQCGYTFKTCLWRDVDEIYSEFLNRSYVREDSWKHKRLFLPYWLHKWLPSALWLLISVKLKPSRTSLRASGKSKSKHARPLSLSLSVLLPKFPKCGVNVETRPTLKSVCMFRNRSPSPWLKEMRTLLSEEALFWAANPRGLHLSKAPLWTAGSGLELWLHEGAP